MNNNEAVKRILREKIDIVDIENEIGELFEEDLEEEFNGLEYIVNKHLAKDGLLDSDEPANVYIKNNKYLSYSLFFIEEGSNGYEEEIVKVDFTNRSNPIQLEDELVDEYSFSDQLYGKVDEIYDLYAFYKDIIKVIKDIEDLI